jgi:hypothetical protein
MAKAATDPGRDETPSGNLMLNGGGELLADEFEARDVQRGLQNAG